MIYKKLDKLQREFKKKVEAFLESCEESNVKIFITETWRSEERQQELIKKGLSKIKHSLHQDGLAFDIGFRGELYPKDFSMWRTVADIARKHGIDWGYDLWKWDKPHFQDNNKKLTTNIMAKNEFIENEMKSNSEKWHELEEEQKRLSKLNDILREQL